MTRKDDWIDSKIEFIPTEYLRNLHAQFGREIERRKVLESAAKVLAVVKKRRILTMPDRGDVERVNGSGLFSLPFKKSVHPSMKLPYLRALLCQDWSHLFPSELDESPRYYVYAHVMPGVQIFTASAEFGGNWGGMPFYIGKGCGDRAHHLKRNQAHGQYIAKALKAGFSPQNIVKIISDGLTEKQAYEIEAKYIYFFGTVYEDKLGVLVNLNLSSRPKFTAAMSKYERLQKKNEHWIAQWNKDHADVLFACDDKETS